MRRKDIKLGMTVYHSTFVHWGPGKVERIVDAGGRERIFEKSRGAKRYLVRFEADDKRRIPARMTARELRKTPDRKKIKKMVAFYCRMGRAVIDGGDRLIFPSDGISGDHGSTLSGGTKVT